MMLKDSQRIYVPMSFRFAFLLDISFTKLSGEILVLSPTESICQIKVKEEKSQNK